jgi:hypothetical protein
MNFRLTYWSGSRKVITITAAAIILVAIGLLATGANKSNPYASAAVLSYEKNCNSSPATPSGSQGGYLKGWDSGDGSPQTTVAEVSCSNLDSAGAFGTTLYVVGSSSNVSTAKSELNSGLSGGSKYCFLVGDDWIVTLSNTDGMGSNDLPFSSDAQSVQSFMGGRIEGACGGAEVKETVTTTTSMAHQVTTTVQSKIDAALLACNSSPSQASLISGMKAVVPEIYGFAYSASVVSISDPQLSKTSKCWGRGGLGPAHPYSTDPKEQFQGCGVTLHYVNGRWKLVRYGTGPPGNVAPTSPYYVPPGAF